MMNGHQFHRRSYGLPAKQAEVGEHCSQRRMGTGRRPGAAGKENVGISNEMREQPRTPKTQGFLSDVRRLRVSRDLRNTREGGSDGKTVNIPLPAIQDKPRPGSDTAAARRNRRLNGVGIYTETGQYREPTGNRIAQVI